METTIIFLAFLVALFTLLVQRQHNRKELQPVLNTNFTQLNQDNAVHVLKLVNHGGGAAIIKQIKLHLKNGEIIEVNKENSFSDILHNKNPTSTKRTTFLPLAVGANSEVLLYEYTIPYAVEDQLSQCYLTITAESIYGDTITVHRDGFDVVSNSRDKLIEDIIKTFIIFFLFFRLNRTPHNVAVRGFGEFCRLRETIASNSTNDLNV
ncbi:TPA: hypothetical protein NJ727_004739 [Vibrio parahaemolyticus]|nr:hypothetical protein [Vibrio parahaemolyticus]HCG9795892.1 hypothetical protein [Vibrio parahaemolyticus]